MMKSVSKILALVFLMVQPAQAQDLRTGIEAHKNGDYEKALKELKPLAERGNGKAQGLLGGMYLRGKGVEKNKATAISWYKKGANSGDLSSQNMLGYFYYKGDGIQKNNIFAYKWWTLVIAEKNPGLARLATIWRNRLLQEMAPEEIAKGEALVKEWHVSHGQK